MSNSVIIFTAVLGFAISWSMLPLIRRHFCSTARRQLHHTYSSPVSRFGGLALVVPFLLVAATSSFVYPVTSTTATEHLVMVSTAFAMFLLGAWDDVRPIGAKRKLIGQVLIASVVYWAGIHIADVKNPLTGSVYSLGAWSYFATVFWLVAFTNLINLIDGVDGVAGGISLIVMGLLLYVGCQSGLTFLVICAAGMCGALLGFLCYNFPPATVYLGDGGAYFLGFLLGLLAMLNSHKGTVAGALIAPLFVLALPIVDVALAILRRAAKGMPIFHPDQRHLHHRLADLGLSRTRIVLIFYGGSLFFLLLGFGIFISEGKWLPILFGVACLVLLAIASSLSFSRRWFSIRKLLGKSRGVRKKTRYALALARWLELEAERSTSPEALWKEFCYLCGKLQFSSVTLSMRDVRKQWEGIVSPEIGGGARQIRFELPGAVVCEISAPEECLDEDAFELVSVLAAEAWITATRCWQRVHHMPFSFTPVAAAAQLQLSKVLVPVSPIQKQTRAWSLITPIFSAVSSVFVALGELVSSVLGASRRTP